MKSLVIIPTYNEAENIRKLIQEIFNYLPQTDILIIDDNSPDGTGKIVDALSAADLRIRVIHRPKKMGMGNAYNSGFRYAIEKGYDVVFEMDADFSHKPEDLPRLLEGLKDNGLVIGSRYIDGGGTVNWGLLRRFVSKGGNLYSRFMLGLNVTDMTAGFRCYNVSALKKIDLDSVRSNGYGFQVEMSYRIKEAGFNIKEIPIIFEDRRAGQSKMSNGIVIEAFIRVLMIRLKLI
ncbi:MAG: polyprenol monophosphomannose synthase [Deltaproteobacteria bacterium]|nr:polyprenol monophosphomannose synthase [Deltaproteobacteria bacterium]MCL5792044.1 polyprenol monophosphomannose synthase [Deltaproteobacteria bacterium]